MCCRFRACSRGRYGRQARKCSKGECVRHCEGPAGRENTNDATLWRARGWRLRRAGRRQVWRCVQRWSLERLPAGEKLPLPARWRDVQAPKLSSGECSSDCPGVSTNCPARGLVAHTRPGTIHYIKRRERSRKREFVRSFVTKISFEGVEVLDCHCPGLQEILQLPILNWPRIFRARKGPARRRGHVRNGNPA